MNRRLVIPIFLLASFILSPVVHADKSKKEERSKYFFSIEKIQETVFEAVDEANHELEGLTPEDIEKLGEKFYGNYIDNIRSYNRTDVAHGPSTPISAYRLDEAFRTEIILEKTLLKFKEKFPHIIWDKSKWMFNNVGGVYARMIMLYCSPYEYVVIWGTHTPQNGFSGYYPYMNEFDVMMSGKMYSYDLEEDGHHPQKRGSVPMVYLPKHTSNLKPGNVRHYELREFTYMVSYAQGNMLKAFWPGAIAPGMFVNQDYKSMKRHITHCAKAYNNSIQKENRPKLRGRFRNIYESLFSHWKISAHNEEEKSKLNRAYDMLKIGEKN